MEPEGVARIGDTHVFTGPAGDGRLFAASASHLPPPTR